MAPALGSGQTFSPSGTLEQSHFLGIVSLRQPRFCTWRALWHSLLNAWSLFVPFASVSLVPWTGPEAQQTLWDLNTKWTQPGEEPSPQISASSMFSGQPRTLATHRELIIYLKIFINSIYNLRFVSPNWDFSFSDWLLSMNTFLQIGWEISYWLFEAMYILRQKIGEWFATSCDTTVLLEVHCKPLSK